MKGEIWTKDRNLKFIDALRGVQDLWNPKCKGYHDIPSKKSLLKKLAKGFGLTDEEAANKIKSLKTMYTRELKYFRWGRKKKPWYALEAMRFLDDRAESDTQESQESPSPNPSEVPTGSAEPSKEDNSESVPGPSQQTAQGLTMQSEEREIHCSQKGLSELEKDCFAKYGEYVAEWLRKSGDGTSALAKLQIDTILFGAEVSSSGWLQRARAAASAASAAAPTSAPHTDGFTQTSAAPSPGFPLGLPSLDLPQVDWTPSSDHERIINEALGFNCSLDPQ